MKTAICGAWHVHASDYTRSALERTDTEVVGFFEQDEKLRAAFSEKYPDILAFSSFEELLASDAKSVICCTSSDTHCEYMVRAAQAKKDIFTEKVLALTSEECERVKNAVKENGVRFAISFPRKYDGGIRRVKEIVDSGELGKINYVRFRNCHGGSVYNWLPEHFFSKKQCGGGAMIDLGAHGMYVIDWLLGLPEKYTSAFTVRDSNPKNTDRLEDNAVTVMTYKDGTIAINETGFVSYADPMSLEVSGDKGYCRWAAGLNVIKSTVQTERKPVTVEELPKTEYPIDIFLSGKDPDGCGIDHAVNLTKMMEGAYANII